YVEHETHHGGVAKYRIGFCEPDGSVNYVAGSLAKALKRDRMMGHFCPTSGCVHFGDRASYVPCLGWEIGSADDDVARSRVCAHAQDRFAAYAHADENVERVFT